jgi:hypothetical protein
MRSGSIVAPLRPGGRQGGRGEPSVRLLGNEKSSSSDLIISNGRLFGPMDRVRA